VSSSFQISPSVLESYSQSTHLIVNLRTSSSLFGCHRLVSILSVSSWILSPTFNTGRYDHMITYAGVDVLPLVICDLRVSSTSVLRIAHVLVHGKGKRLLLARSCNRLANPRQVITRRAHMASRVLTLFHLLHHLELLSRSCQRSTISHNDFY